MGSNPTTPAYMNNDLWKELFRSHLDEAEAIYRLAQDFDMLNEQEFLNWQDELNEISCR